MVFRPSLRELVFWAPPVATMAVVSISLSISMPLFALLLERIGASGTVIGLNHTIAALAMVLSAPLLPRVLSRLGPVRLALGAIGILALSTALIPLWESVWWWGLLRIGWGAAGTALFFVSEFWLVTVAPDALRGRIIGIYVLILSASYMTGPLLLNALGIDSWLTFAVPTAIILASAVPVILGRANAPPGRREEPPGVLSLFRFFRTDPVIIWSIVLFGVVEFGAMGLVTIWGLRVGHDQATSIQFVFWLAFGSMLFQLPVGWAADRFDRRKLLALVGAVSLVMPLMVIAFAGVAAIVSLLVLIWGGMAVACYSLALTELGQRYRGAILAEANAAVMLAYGLGALLAPAALGTAMDALPPHGMLWLAAVAGGTYFALTIYRIRTVPRDSLDTPGENGT